VSLVVRNMQCAVLDAGERWASGKDKTKSELSRTCLDAWAAL